MFGRYRRPIGPLASMALALLVAAIWCEVWDAEIGTVYHKTEEGRAPAPGLYRRTAPGRP